MNKILAIHVMSSFLKAGGIDVCVCPGSRNSPLVSLVAANTQIKAYYFYEERSAAFFALGLSRRTKRPVAVVTTSGTAAVELMPAITEAYYTGVPLVAITADRPRSYRGTNAPQSCEQVGLYGIYATWSADLDGSESLDMSSWDKRGPAHINVCFHEPLKCSFDGSELQASDVLPAADPVASDNLEDLTRFLEETKHPFVIVGDLDASVRESVRLFLLRLNLPAYIEGTSGLREDPSLSHLRIHQSVGLWKSAANAGYPVDGVLRIGGIPTVRLWRDLEDLEGKVRVCSVSERPFSGLSWAGVIFTPLGSRLDDYTPPHERSQDSFKRWREFDVQYQEGLEQLFRNEPASEASLVHALAAKIPQDAFVYVGNGLPIREWDMAAPYRDRGFDVWATRGLSGIDGQVSTFLGLSQPGKSNWALLGDLTTLYDMSGFWVASQLNETSFNLVVINNGGGQIFSRMYVEPQFLNSHSLNFKALADLWGIQYEIWKQIPDTLPDGGRRIIEIVPDGSAYHRFWDKLISLGAQP